MTTIETPLPSALAPSLPVDVRRSAADTSTSPCVDRVTCPVCGTGGMLREQTAQGHTKIDCTNEHCRSNGGLLDVRNHIDEANARPFGHFRKMGRHGPWLECRRTDAEAIALFTCATTPADEAAFDRRKQRGTALGRRQTPILRGLTAYLDSVREKSLQAGEQLMPMSAYKGRHGAVLCFHFAENQALPQVKYANPLEPTFDKLYWTHFMCFNMAEVLEAAQAFVSRESLRGR